jgi:hypothetical protein
LTPLPTAVRLAVMAGAADPGEISGVVWVGDSHRDEPRALGFVVRDGAGLFMADGAGGVSCEADRSLLDELAVVSAGVAAGSAVLFASLVFTRQTADGTGVEHFSARFRVVVMPDPSESFVRADGWCVRAACGSGS